MSKYVRIPGKFKPYGGLNTKLLDDEDIEFQFPFQSHGIWIPPTIPSTGAGVEERLITGKVKGVI
jgi:hypothetical protein